jgi:hypothetical protein
MSLTVASSGTTATDGTLQTLATETTAGVYSVEFNLVNIANGDIIELTVQTKTLTGSSYGTVFHAVYGHAQAEVIKVSPPITVPFGIKVLMKLTDGTNRDIYWSVNRL